MQMNDEEVRLKIYERLGLEIGSLSSESGNDWERAKKEVLDEIKQKEFEFLSSKKSINYGTIEKNSEEYKMALKSHSILANNFKVQIAQRNDLSDDEVNSLLSCTDKDILINLVKYQILSPENIDLIIPNSVYLVKKYLIEKQNLTDTQKQLLKSLMLLQESLYYDLLIKI